jgi:capsid protein
MGLKEFIFGTKKNIKEVAMPIHVEPPPPPSPVLAPLSKTAEQTLAQFPGGTYYDLGTYSYNGEKNVGGVGPMIDYKLDFNGLAIRGWQAMLESDKAQIAIKRLLTWIIGNGFKPQCEPIMSILADEGIKIEKQKYAKSVEDRWNLFRKLKSVSHDGQQNLNELQLEAEKNSMVAGDMLVILRYIKGQIKIQHIDRMNVQSPYYGSEYFPQALDNGNCIVDGVEINSKREHVAYYVRTYALTSDFNKLFEYKFERVPAYDTKTGLRRAFIYYADKHRINNVRGIPIISACIEKLKKMEEYSDSVLDQAKEAAKVSYQVVHELNGDGKAPWANNTVRGYNKGIGNDNVQLPVTADGVTTNNTINVTSMGTAYNNTPGSKIEMLQNDNPLYFKEFNETHSNEFFAVMGIPPNVAMGLYNDSYSASRASQMDWLHILLTKREHHKVGYLDYIFAFWLDIKILEGVIQAPGYLLARSQGNDTILQAYRGIRFIGINPPHIDPKKEIEAARLVLGSSFDHVPLDDMESTVERLGLGNYNENIEQASDELKKANNLGIKPIPMEQKVVDNKKLKNDVSDLKDKSNT